jgi:hypothetical protein
MAGLAIQFSLYEKGKKLLLSRTHRLSRGNASPPLPSFFVLYILARRGTSADFILSATEQGLSPVEYLGIASGAKGIASVITYPHEVLRTRFREQRGKERRYTGLVQAVRLIAKEEGVAGLYGGLGPHLLKVPSSHARNTPHACS